MSQIARDRGVVGEGVFDKAHTPSSIAMRVTDIVNENGNLAIHRHLLQVTSAFDKAGLSNLEPSKLTAVRFGAGAVAVCHVDQDRSLLVRLLSIEEYSYEQAGSAR